MSQQEIKNLQDIYEVLHKDKSDSSLIKEENKDMTVGKHKGGDELEGPVKGIATKGPEDVDGVDNDIEEAEALSPVKKTKKNKVKENTTMAKPSFNDLYMQVIKEEDIEDSSYNDEVGDFPPEAGMEGEDDFGLEDGDMGEEVTVSLSTDQIDILRSIIDQVDGGEEGEAGLEDDEFAGDEFEDDEFEDIDPAMRESYQRKARRLSEKARVMRRLAKIAEMKSEPEAKPHNSNTKSLQHPRKLAGVGVKTKNGKAQNGSGGKKRTGELETGPEGYKGGDKSKMKVKGSGPAHTAGNASALES